MLEIYIQLEAIMRGTGLPKKKCLRDRTKDPSRKLIKKRKNEHYKLNVSSRGLGTRVVYTSILSGLSTRETLMEIKECVHINVPMPLK